MTADLTPAQAARLEAIGPVLSETTATVQRYLHEAAQLSADDAAWHAGLLAALIVAQPRLLAAIDVMRGAADDGAIGRVLALADEHDGKHSFVRLDRRPENEMDLVQPLSTFLRAAVGAPATAEGDEA